MLRKRRLPAVFLAVALFAGVVFAPMSGTAHITATTENKGPVSNSVLAQWAQQPSGNEMWFMMDYLSKQQGWKSGYDIISQTGWIYNQSQKLAYTMETERSLQKKIEYIDNNDMAGIIVWDAQGDDMNTWPMFSTMKEGLKDSGREVIAYWGNWMVYGDGGDHIQGQDSTNIPWDKITSLHYSFFGLSDGTTEYPRNSSAVPKFGLVTLDEHVDFDWAHTDNPANAQGEETGLSNEKAGVGKKYGQGSVFDYYWHYNQLEEMSAKAKENDVRLMLSVGGWTRSNLFHEMCLTQANRKVFIDSCVSFLKDFPEFGGIDLDWEYPGISREPEDSIDKGSVGGPEDTANFTALCREMRQAFDREFPGRHIYLSTCASADQNEKLNYLDAKGIEPYVDYINIMTYDYAGGWDGSLSGYNSPIYSEKGSDSWCVDHSVQWFKDRDVDLSKVNIGSPLYGPGYTNTEADAFGNPVGLPNPMANGLQAGTTSVNAGATSAVNVKYTFNDNTTRTPQEVHNPVTATIISGAGNVEVFYDTSEPDKLMVRGLKAGTTATLEIRDELDGFVTTATVNVLGEAQALEIKNLTASRSGGSYNISGTVVGGIAPYSCYVYIVKDGTVWAKFTDDTGIDAVFTPSESGRYTVLAYAKDTANKKVKSIIEFIV